MRLSLFAGPAILAAFAVTMPAQSVISAKSGTVNYIEGKVLLDDKPVETKFGSFPNIKEKSEFRTEEGRAEVLLGSGIFLRVGENSAVRLLSSSLMDPSVEFVRGSVVLDWVEAEKDSAVTIKYQDSTMTIVKRGVYRLDSDPAQLRVYDGEAKVVRDGQSVTVKKSKLIALSGVGVPEKFDSKANDALLRWARRRTEYVAMANLSAARSSYRSGITGSSGWVWNPWFGMFTYVPVNGFLDSYWGYRFWSPYYVANYYVPNYGYSHSGSHVTSSSGYTGVPATTSNTSGTVASSPAPARQTSAPSAPAPVASGGAGMGGGGGHAGGRGR